jgi:hypothetical protein
MAVASAARVLASQIERGNPAARITLAVTAAAMVLLGGPPPSSAYDSSGPAPVQILIKRHKVLVPPPVGMVSVLGQDWMLDGILQGTTSKQYYLEAVFIPSFVWDLYQERHADDQFLTDFAVVQTSKRLQFDDQDNCDNFYRMRRALNESFRLQIASMASPLRQVMDASTERAARAAISNVEIDDGRMVPLSIMRNDDESFTAVCATRFSATVDGQKKSWMMVVGMSMVLVKDRIVYLYKYKRGAPDPTRVAAVRRSLAVWTNAVLNENGSQLE